MGKEGHIPPALQYRLLGQGIGIAPEGGVIPGWGYPYQEHPGPFDRQAEQGKYQPDPDRPQLLQPTAQQRQPLPARYQDGNCQRQGLPGLPILPNPQHQPADQQSQSQRQHDPRQKAGPRRQTPFHRLLPPPDLTFFSFVL